MGRLTTQLLETTSAYMENSPKRNKNLIKGLLIACELATNHDEYVKQVVVKIKSAKKKKLIAYDEEHRIIQALIRGYGFTDLHKENRKYNIRIKLPQSKRNDWPLYSSSNKNWMKNILDKADVPIFKEEK